MTAKKLFKGLGILLVVATLFCAGVIGSVELGSYLTKRRVVHVVAQLIPGTPLSAVVQQLGTPVQTFTNGEEIISWVKGVGSEVDPGIARHSVLHTFAHNGPPIRWILVYTDPESQKVVYANWCSM